MKRILGEGIAGLFPGYFSLCMATGIVSIACFLEGMPRLARALLYLNVPAYAILVLFTLARLCLYRDRMKADISDHGRAPGFFTTVAATNVLGTELLVIEREVTGAWFLWIVGV